jgi:hypothetical protein
VRFTAGVFQFRLYIQRQAFKPPAQLHLLYLLYNTVLAEAVFRQIQRRVHLYRSVQSGDRENVLQVRRDTAKTHPAVVVHHFLIGDDDNGNPHIIHRFHFLEITKDVGIPVSQALPDGLDEIGGIDVHLADQLH